MKRINNESVPMDWKLQTSGVGIFASRAREENTLSRQENFMFAEINSLK
jgi:hypothetical protein